MTEVKRYDGAYAPNGQQFLQLYAAGGRQFMGYVGGPRVYHQWSAADFAAGRAAGFEMGGVYVGLQGSDFSGLDIATAQRMGVQGGVAAITLAHERTLAAGSRLALDVEAGAAGAAAEEYARAWAQTVRSAGFYAEIYGLIAFCNAVGDAFDGAWAADYITTDPGTANAPGLAVDAGHRAWQWRNSHTEAGANVDTSDVDASAPAAPQETNRMLSDQDVVRLSILAVRAALLGDGPGTPDEAAAIEAYVAATVANPEGGLSALISDCQRDGRYLPGRVAALETWAKAQQAEAPAAPAPVVDISPLDARVAALETFRANVKGA